jgi:hypothetical protein
MLSPAVEKKNGETGFILTGVSPDRDSPCLWGFEVFNSEWQRLARFTYKSEREAAWAATNFAWVIRRIAAVSLSPAFLPT